jgi:DNA-binding XRE family transcriptional regulator
MKPAFKWSDAFDLLKSAHPEAFAGLPQRKLRAVENAVRHALELGEAGGNEVLSPDEHKEFLKSLTGKDRPAPGDYLRAYRMRSGLTQQQLARKSGVSQANISAMESGRRVIGANSAKRLALALKCDYRRLL